MLRPVSPGDLDYLYGLYTREEIGFRWVFRGATPNPSTMRDQMFSGVLVQFLIVHRRSGEPIGLVSCYNANQVSGYGYLALVIDPAHQGSGSALEAAALFCNYLFTVWPFRVIYAEGIEFNFNQFGSALGRYFTEVGRIPHREYFDGVYWDWVIAELRRPVWEKLSSNGHRLIRRAG